MINHRTSEKNNKQKKTKKKKQIKQPSEKNKTKHPPPKEITHGIYKETPL